MGGAHWGTCASDIERDNTHTTHSRCLFHRGSCPRGEGRLPFHLNRSPPGCFPQPRREVEVVVVHRYDAEGRACRGAHATLHHHKHTLSHAAQPLSLALSYHNLHHTLTLLHTTQPPPCLINVCVVPGCTLGSAGSCVGPSGVKSDTKRSAGLKVLSTHSLCSWIALSPTQWDACVAECVCVCL